MFDEKIKLKKRGDINDSIAHIFYTDQIRWFLRGFCTTIKLPKKAGNNTT